MISEPMTVATDYALAVVSAWLGWNLFKSISFSQRLWALAFFSLALAAALGGTWHGFWQNDLLWKATTLSAGVASFGMVVGSAAATGFFRILVLLAGVKLLVYSMWMLSHEEFIYVVIDSGTALAVVAVLHLWRFNGWMLAGVAVSVAGALAQASGFALHPDFNHNDLYHVIQIVAMVLFYRGAKSMQHRVS